MIRSWNLSSESGKGGAVDRRHEACGSCGSTRKKEQEPAVLFGSDISNGSVWRVRSRGLGGLVDLIQYTCGRCRQSDPQAPFRGQRSSALGSGHFTGLQGNYAKRDLFHDLPGLHRARNLVRGIGSRHLTIAASLTLPASGSGTKCRIHSIGQLRHRALQSKHFCPS